MGVLQNIPSFRILPSKKGMHDYIFVKLQQENIVHIGVPKSKILLNKFCCIWQKSLLGLIS